MNSDVIVACADLAGRAGALRLRGDMTAMQRALKDRQHP